MILASEQACEAEWNQNSGSDKLEQTDAVSQSKNRAFSAAVDGAWRCYKLLLMKRELEFSRSLSQLWSLRTSSLVEPDRSRPLSL